MTPLEAKDSEFNAKVKVEIEAEFDVDLLDHVSLADRRRLVRSDSPVWSADMAARHVSPSFLKDFFLEDLGRVTKPVSSFFTGEIDSSCNCVETQSHHEQIYDVILPPDGRIAKVFVHNSVVSSNSMHTHSPHNIGIRGGSHRLMLNIPKTSSPAVETKAHSASRFSIKMNFKHSESSPTYSSVDYLQCDCVKLKEHKHAFGRNETCNIILEEELLRQTGRQHFQASESCIPETNRSDHATYQEKDKASSCLPEDAGEAICHMEMYVDVPSDTVKENVHCSDRENESHKTLSASKDPYTISQHQPGFSHSLNNFSPSSQEGSPLPLNLPLLNEVPLVGFNNQILEPLPLSIQDAVNKNTIIDQLLEVSNIHPLDYQCSSEDRFDIYSRSSNLHANNASSRSIPCESHDISLAPPVLKKIVKLESHAETLSNPIPERSDYILDNPNTAKEIALLSSNCIEFCATASSLENREDNVESKCTASISEVKATVFGQKRVQCDSDIMARDSSPLSSSVRVKKEPIDANDLENGVNAAHILSSDLSNIQSCASINRGECFSPLANHPGKSLPVNGQNQDSSANELVSDSMPTVFSRVKPEFFEETPVIASGNSVRSSLEFPFNVKEILKFPEKSLVDDELDFIPLHNRRKLLLHNRSSHSNFHHSNKLEESQPCLTTKNAFSSHNAKNDSVNQRKRKRTATNSVQTALQEDAPELLQVLIDNGINPNDIRLYESMDGDDDELLLGSSESSFDELENVIVKLFSEHQNIINLGSLQDEKESKTVYCLACLISLIEQTRYLRMRDYPVEWGWCRDLLSFVFVFQKHNRIVLERPEYGYATYFFELVESFPVEWQIKRLVTALKLTKTCRSILLDNKSLVIGEDVTEGEARVLEQYGWIPNSGLGSLLNFCDRVIHDRTKDIGNSDWRAKIGKLLKNGYDRGKVVISELPKKVSEYIHDQQQTLKLELCQD